jgi:hypothetical protein
MDLYKWDYLKRDLNKALETDFESMGIKKAKDALSMALSEAEIIEAAAIEVQREAHEITAAIDKWESEHTVINNPKCYSATLFGDDPRCYAIQYSGVLM